MTFRHSQGHPERGRGVTIDEELQAALDVDPSPEFVARVRMRIAKEPAPRRSAWAFRWLLPSAALAAAAVAIAVFVSRPVEDVRVPAELLTARRLPAIEVPNASRNMTVPDRARPAQVTAPNATVQDADLAEIVLDLRETAALRRLTGGMRGGVLDLRSVSSFNGILEPAPVDVLAIPEIPAIPAIVIDALPVGSEGVLR